VAELIARGYLSEFDYYAPTVPDTDRSPHDRRRLQPRRDRRADGQAEADRRRGRALRPTGRRGAGHRVRGEPGALEAHGRRVLWRGIHRRRTSTARFMPTRAHPIGRRVQGRGHPRSSVTSNSFGEGVRRAGHRLLRTGAPDEILALFMQQVAAPLDPATGNRPPSSRPRRQRPAPRPPGRPAHGPSRAGKPGSALGGERRSAGPPVQDVLPGVAQRRPRVPGLRGGVSGHRRGTGPGGGRTH
jgi:hypothetical protein